MMVVLAQFSISYKASKCNYSNVTYFYLTDSFSILSSAFIEMRINFL